MSVQSGGHYARPLQDILIVSEAFCFWELLESVLEDHYPFLVQHLNNRRILLLNKKGTNV